MLAEEIAAATPFGWFTADPGTAATRLARLCHGAEIPWP